MRLIPSPQACVGTVLQDFQTFLQDHASAEKTAHGMALRRSSPYTNPLELVNAMVDFAVEEIHP